MKETGIEKDVKEAAMRVFISKGYESTSMSDIARTAGIGSLTLVIK